MAGSCVSTQEESREQILYQTCYHARKFPKSLGVAGEQDREINHSVRSIFPWISIRGLKQLRISWLAPREPIIVNQGRSLVVSSSGEYIAILFQHQVTILSKHDDFKETFGTFTGSPEAKVFLHGVWVGHWNVLAVSDNLDTIYFLKPNGDELKRIPKSHLKAGGKISGLFVQEDKSAEMPYRYNFMVLTSDCMLHRIAINQDTVTVVPSRNRSIIQSKLRRQHPFDISCLCFHSGLSVLVLVGPCKTNEMGLGSTGLYCVSVWRFIHTADLELICCKPELKGTFSFAKSHQGPFCAPKVAISSHGEHLAVLDLTGNLHVFTLEGSSVSTCAVTLDDKSPIETSDGGRTTVSKSLDDIIDFEWWSERSLIIAKRSGMAMVIEVPTARILLKNVPMFSSPVLGRDQSSEGHIFVLECIFSDHLLTESSRSVQQAHSKDVQDNMETSYSSQFEIKHNCLGWQLLSMHERSVLEMYKILIDGQSYDAALEFAVQHGLDKDEVLKLQWLHSDYEKESIQNYLSNIQDRRWVLLECVDKVGSSVDAAHAILSYGLVETDHYRFQEAEKADCSLFWWFCRKRLRLLQYKDRLETFLGINMGRFSSQEYAAFRSAPLNEIGIDLAENGKIGALNLLFKRHTYTLAPFILSILGAVPETIPVHSYSQLLPGLSPPKIAVSGRDEDWVENQEMLGFIESLLQEEDDKIDLRMSTEHMVRLHCGFVWPSAMKVIEWYRERARAIDRLSGQLENCLSLVDFGHRKGIMDLRPLFEDISDLCHVIFSGGYVADTDIDTSLTAWEQLCDYDKFKIMLKGVNEATVVERLKEQAIPFMHRKHGTKDALGKGDTVNCQSVSLLDSVENSETFLVKWLKEIAEDNQLEVCSAVIEEGCKDSQVNLLFKNERETIEVGLHCIYACMHTDRWGLMSSLLSNLPRKCLRDEDSFAGLEDMSPRQGFRRGLGRVLGNSSNRKSSNSKLSMSPMFLDEEESSESSTGGGHDVCHNQEKGPEVPENLEKRLKLAEGHVEAGRLLAHYQVAKPIRFFLEAHKNEKAVKQILRLLLSKFGRRQPGRSDTDWAVMWRDMQCFQEKAFPFLDTEFMLLEFCRGLLKAGKFSLARNYLKGTASTALAPEKAEILVIQAAREYFYSASSLDSFEIWKAKECLDLFPNSNQVKAEADVIDAITVKLPRLGVTLLPMQFRQIRDPMDIVKMAITSQTGAYLKVKELIEVARLLGLSSPDDIAIVEAAIAREAGATGDLQLAVDLCLLLARKDHGSVWDLCAALGRGPDLDKMDLQSRKELLGFALSHCDEESVGELLHAWKELDLASQCENLGTAIGKKVPTLSDQEALVASFPIKNIEEIINLIESSQTGCTDTLSAGEDKEEVLKILEDAISSVTNKFSSKKAFDWDALLKENKRFMAFATLQLPWLLELNRTSSYETNSMLDVRLPMFAKECFNVNARAAAAILYWLAGNDTIPRDDLIVSIGKSAMEKPVTQEDDIIGCSYLLNLSDPHVGVKVIEEELEMRKEYQEVHSAMKMGLIYSSLQGSASEYETPKQRRDLLVNKFWESQPPTDSDCVDEREKIKTTFWREWRSRIAEQQRLADQSRVLEHMIPGVETRRFLSGDSAYIQSTIFSLVESMKMEKKSVLSKALMLANIYGVNRSEVLIRHLCSLLVSELWNNEEVAAEISEQYNELLEHAAELIEVLCSDVYPAIDGSNKQRLAFLYKVLSDCCMRIEEVRKPECLFISSVGNIIVSEKVSYYKALEQECFRVSFIEHLNFKNLAGLDELNYDCFSEAVLVCVNDSNVESLATMVDNLRHQSKDARAKALLSSQSVYKHYILKSLCGFSASSLENKNEIQSGIVMTAEDCKSFLHVLDQRYDACRIYLKCLTKHDLLDVLRAFYESSISIEKVANAYLNYRMDPESQLACSLCLCFLLNIWTKAIYDALDHMDIDVVESDLDEHSVENLKALSQCFEVFKTLLMERRVTARQGWMTLSGYVKLGPLSCSRDEILNFFKTMISSGCSFWAIALICFQRRSAVLLSTSTEFDKCTSHQKAVHELGERLTNSGVKQVDPLHDVQEAYVNAIDSALFEIHSQASHDSAIEIDKISSRSLCSLLSSLSGVVDGADGVKAFDPQEPEFILLQSVRHVVWAKLSAFAEDLQLPNQARVYALELLQFIGGRHTIQTISIQDNNLLPWEGWDAFQCSGTESQVGQGSESNVHRFTSILVALKSTELISGFWPEVEVNGKDLETVESATSLFCALASTALSQSHVLALQMLLKEWEGLFQTDNQISEIRQIEDTEKATDPQDGWSEEDGWDDGWETFQYPKEEIDDKMKMIAPVHRLHICWMIILEKLIEQHQLEEVMRLLDETCSNKNTVLLTEDEAQKLIGILSRLQPVLALKSALLLPYDSLWFQTLKMVNDKLKHGSTFDIQGDESITVEELDSRNKAGGGVDYGLLALILSVGLLPSLAGDPAFSTVFFHCCASLGQLACSLQENHLCLVRKEDQHCISAICDHGSVFFSSIAFPYFIAELTRRKHYFLAGALVLQFMHAPTSLSTINSVYVALEKYLEIQVQAEQLKHQCAMGSISFPHCLKNTVDGLKDKLGNVLKSALSILCEDLK